MNVRISEETLLAALKAWPLPKPDVLRRLPGGFTSDVWRVEAGGAVFVAKYTEQAPDAFNGGLAAAEVAGRAGINSGAPLRTTEGKLSCLVAKYFAYRIGAGVTLGDPGPNSNARHLAEARQALGLLLSTL